MKGFFFKDLSKKDISSLVFIEGNDLNIGVGFMFWEKIKKEMKIFF